MIQMCKMILSAGILFYTFKILILQIVRGLKKQKMAQNDKFFGCRTMYCKTIYGLHLRHTRMHQMIYHVHDSILICMLVLFA